MGIDVLFWRSAEGITPRRRRAYTADASEPGMVGLEYYQCVEDTPENRAIEDVEDLKPDVPRLKTFFEDKFRANGL